jgi:hypothetical protein
MTYFYSTEITNISNNQVRRISGVIRHWHIKRQEDLDSIIYKIEHEICDVKPGETFNLVALNPL